MDGNAESRVALITGGGKGVGAGVARVLAADGIRLCLGCNTNAAMAQDTLNDIRQSGGEAFVYQADVSDPDQVEAMVQAVIDRYGRLDILVNNAAMQPNLSIEEYDAQSLMRLYSINLGGYWRCAKAAVKYLRQSPCGRIVNMSSIHATRPTCFDVGYAMTKGAIRQFTRELALELYSDNITVNSVALGGCRIEFKTGHPPFRAKRPPSTGNPAMRGVKLLVEPRDVGQLIRYLISPEASAVTGDAIRIDRGLILI